MAEPRKPNPSFYRVIAVVFLVIGAVLIWQAVMRHEWFYWAIAILTIVNGLMSWLKSLVPRETQK
jgi:O-antigen ligase